MHPFCGQILQEPVLFPLQQGSLAGIHFASWRGCKLSLPRARDCCRGIKVYPYPYPGAITYRTAFIPLRKNQLTGICFYLNLIVNYLALVSKTLQYIALLLNFICGLGNEALLHCSSLYLDTEVCRKWVSASKSDERLKKIFLSIPSWL